MAHLRIQHTLQGASNLPEDRFVNVFHVRTPAVVTTSDLDSVIALIAAFYDTNPTGESNCIANYLNSGSDASGRNIKIYDMADPMPRAPIRQGIGFTSAWNAGTNNLPEEIAICLSYKGAPSSGVPVARTRGRIYLGPWATSVIDSGTNLVQAKPAQTIRDVMLAAGKDLANDLAALGYQWCVWSPTDSLLHTIVQVSVDNAFDVQRRRGHAPDLRIVLAV